MDVGNPSNFIRIQEMYHNDLQFKRTFLLILTDEETTEAMKVIYGTSGYIAEPHGAGLFRAKKRVTKLSQCYWYFPRNSTSY
jgi:threonine synthase